MIVFPFSHSIVSYEIYGDLRSFDLEVSKRVHCPFVMYCGSVAEVQRISESVSDGFGKADQCFEWTDLCCGIEIFRSNDAKEVPLGNPWVGDSSADGASVLRTGRNDMRPLSIRIVSGVLSLSPP